jgi:hypothetical protein
MGISHRRRVIRKQGSIELQHVMRRVEVRVVVQWADAYRLTVFQEPDWKRAG